MKKITSLAMVMIMVIATLTVGAFVTSAAETKASYAVSGNTLIFSEGTYVEKPGLDADDISAITAVRIEDGITSVRSGALSGLNRLSSVYFGKDVASVASDTFGYGTTGTKVEKFELSASNTGLSVISDGAYLLNRDGTELIRAGYGKDIPVTEIAPKLVKIGDYAFENNGLTGDSNGKITIPDTVRVIGKSAFAQNTIRSIDKFGNQLNTIGNEAFANISGVLRIGSIDNPKIVIAIDAFKNDAVMIDSFNGTEEEWNDVSRNNSILSTATVSANSNASEWVVYDSITTGGTLASNPENVVWNGSESSGFTITATNPVPADSTKLFLGWSESATATTPTYTASSNFISSNGNARSVRLYAVFGAGGTERWKVTYDANGGKFDADTATTVEVVKGSSTQTLSAQPTNDKYDLAGWSTTASATVPTYEPGASFTPAADTTLYAIWNTAGPFTVKFDGSADKITDKVENIPTDRIKDVTKGSAIEVKNPTSYYADDPSIVRYAFVGWSLTKGSSRADYEAGEETTSIGNITSNLTLYAVWKNNGPFDVKFYNNWQFTEEYFMSSVSYTNAMGNAKERGEQVTIPAFPQNGSLTSDYWLSDDGLLQYLPGQVITVERDITFYPNWKGNAGPAKTALMNLSGTIQRTVNYKTNVKVYVEVQNVPTENGFYLLTIYENGSLRNSAPIVSGSLVLEWTTPEPLTEGTDITVKVCDAHGNPLQNAQGPMLSKIHISVNKGLFARIIAFFRTLFKRIPTETIGSAL